MENKPTPETVAVLFVGRTPNSMSIHGIFDTEETARATAEEFIPWPSGWAGNVLIDLGNGWTTARVEVWTVQDKVAARVID